MHAGFVLGGCSSAADAACRSRFYALNATRQRRAGRYRSAAAAPTAVHWGMRWNVSAIPSAAKRTRRWSWCANGRADSLHKRCRFGLRGKKQVLLRSGGRHNNRRSLALYTFAQSMQLTAEECEAILTLLKSNGPQKVEQIGKQFPGIANLRRMRGLVWLAKMEVVRITLPK